MKEIAKRKALVKIGEELQTLTKDDIKFILDLNNSDNAVNRRMITARERTLNVSESTVS